jgi:hypothetical protein
VKVPVRVAAVRVSCMTMRVRTTDLVVTLAVPETVGVAMVRGSRDVPVTSEAAQSHDAQTSRTKDQTCYIGIHRTPSVLALEYRRRFGTTE